MEQNKEPEQLRTEKTNQRITSKHQIVEQGTRNVKLQVTIWALNSVFTLR